MTELDLERLLDRGARRVRASAALYGACAGVGLALGASALAVVAARVQPAWSGTVMAALPWTAAGVALCAGVCFWRSRPAPLRVALLLDTRAGLAEHLTTWLDRRGQPSGDPLAQGFQAAQRNATLRAAAGLHPARLLPLRLPAWTRALWLGLLALGCALLMPAQSGRENAGHTRPATAEGSPREAGAQAGPLQPLAALPQNRAFKINPLSPEELFKARLTAGDEQAPEFLKAELLAELEAKVAGLSEAELDDRVREVLAQLRRPQGRDPKEAAPPPHAGSVAQEGSEKPEAPHGTAEHRGAPEAALSPVELTGIAQDRFPDVAEALARFYAAARPNDSNGGAGRIR
ncbi:MAG: hypothetical protein AMXMBFR7_40260 [Planctomycetota bacterium]